MNLKGHLDLLLLGALQRSQPVHGYALIAAVRELSADAFDLAEGTVYPVLRRLEDRGLVTSDWDHDSPRPRRVYQLSAQGVTALENKRREWVAYRGAVDTVALDTTRLAST